MSNVEKCGSLADKLRELSVGLLVKAIHALTNIKTRIEGGQYFVSYERNGLTCYRKSGSRPAKTDKRYVKIT